MIYGHNRCLQDDLKLEKNMEVEEWSFWVNSSLLATGIDDAWNLYKSSDRPKPLKSAHSFYCELTDELTELHGIESI